MNDMLNSLEGFDSGSNYKFGNKMEKSNNPRSLFDLSHLNTLTIQNAGLLVPIALWETLPSDDFDINVDCLLRVMPQVVPLYSRQRMYIYGFWSRYSDLWNNWQVFIDKGYTGNVQKKIPILYSNDFVSGDFNVNYSITAVQPDTLPDYLGLPIGKTMQSLFVNSNGAVNAGISALPFMMYLRIYRDYFMNKNEWINDRVLLPDDDSRFRLDDNGHLLSAVDDGNIFSFNMGANDLYITSHPSGKLLYSSGLLYHDYPDDYFTSALPFTQRGTTPTLNARSTSLTGNIPLKFPDTFYTDMTSGSTSYDYALMSGNFGDTEGKKMYMIDPANHSSGTSSTNTYTGYAKDAFERGLAVANNTPVSVSLGITLEDIRKLAIDQIELERLARTDGSYKQFGLSFFGESSKASYDFRPLYIGGTYKNITFTEVLQTAGSTVPTTAESGNSPLGAYAGHGITGISQGRIGHIHCDDYGMIMLIACIMPDVYYSQGLDRIFTDSLQSEKFLPERVKLGMQPIYNKELYYAGNNGSSSGEDNYLWAYQNPFDWLRYMPNKIHGKIADSNNKSFFPYTQSRKFTQLPNWGRDFSEAKDVRKDYLFAPSEDAYSAQFSINIRAVRPLPYKAIPAEIIN